MNISVGKVDLMFSEKLNGTESVFIRKNGIWTLIQKGMGDKTKIRTSSSLSALINDISQEANNERSES